MTREALLSGALVTTLTLMVLWGVHRLWMTLRFLRTARRRSDDARRAETVPLPDGLHVTVQVPLYNERTVAARSIRAAGALRYPRERLEIQVLDDSDDETRGIVDREVAELVACGVDARVVRRANRVGYKAGALEHGQRSARGDFFCIFDADFQPPADFLERLVPRFADPGIGMVQARWEHRNRDESLLTRAQSTLLDGHFVIEHDVRYRAGLFFNFNGTAGIWRRAAIDDAGGWEHDTLTEDLDLSYRAQLAGWRFEYVPFVTAPAEVPPDISAFKSQQHRWAKGSVQVARKLGGRILRADIPRRHKLEAFAHLTGNVGYPLVLALALLLPPALSLQRQYSAWWHLATFVLCTASVILFYDTSQRALGRGRRARLRDVPAAMSLGIGMSLAQTRAVLEGFVQRTGEFVRTPKRGEAPAEKRYLSIASRLPGLELFLAAWFAWGIARAVERGMWGSLPFLGLFFFGFAWVGAQSVLDALDRAAARARASGRSGWGTLWPPGAAGLRLFRILRTRTRRRRAPSWSIRPARSITAESSRPLTPRRGSRARRRRAARHGSSCQDVPR